MAELARYFSYPFVRYAFAVGVMVALCAALIGVVLVLKRFSFLGDGLSHFAFGVIAAASVAGLTDNMLVVLPVTVLCAVLLLRAGQNAKIKGDAAVAMISVSSLAVGYLLLNLFSTSANVSGDVCGTLFGSAGMLTLGRRDMVLCALMTGVTLMLFILFHNRIFTVSFDESFSTATGTRASLFNTVTAVMAAVVIVLGMKLVGSLLITALIVFPALGAMRLFKSFRVVTVFAGVFAVMAAVGGFLLSLVLSAPVGATMAVTDMVLFGICAAVGRMKN